MEFHDPFESCPYNVFHRIRRSRMQFHVTTCAQNHRHVTGMVQCPFDARHVIKHIEFEHHKRTCPARASVIDYAIHDTVSQAKLKILPIDINPVGQWDEKWDDDADVKTYNPIQYIKDKPIVYPLIGVSKAKRKNHRLQERIRYSKVIENEGGNMSQNRFYSRQMSTNSEWNSTMEVVHEIHDNTNEAEKPLRPPSKFVIAHLTDKTYDDYTNQISTSPAPEVLSTSSKFDQSSVHSSSSGAASSNSQETSCSKKSSENQGIFKKSSKAIDINSENSSNQSACSIHNRGSVISNKDEHQFNQHKSNNKEKLPSDADNIVFSKNSYQFIQYRLTDQEKISTSDIKSIASSKDNYEFIQNQLKDQEKCPIFNINSSISSKDNQFSEYELKSQKNCSTPDTDSIISSKNDFSLNQYKYKIQRKYSIPDTISIVSDKSKYQCYQHQSEQSEHLEKLSILDTVSIASSNDEYQFAEVLIRTSSGMSLSSSISSTSEIESVFSCEDDELIIQMLSTTIKEADKNNKNNEEILIKDTVYNLSSGNESPHNMTLMNGNLVMSSSSSEEVENTNHSFSSGIKQSRNYSIKSIETNSTENTSIFDKLSKTIEELAMNNEDYKKKSESLDQELNKLKKLPPKKSVQINGAINSKKGKLFRRCGANFLNLEKC